MGVKFWTTKYGIKDGSAEGIYDIWYMGERGAFKMEVQRGYMGERGECIHLKWTEDEPRNPKFNGGKSKWRHLVEC